MVRRKLSDVQKLIIIFLLTVFTASAQNYELGAGAVIAKDKDYQVGYYIETNFIIRSNQDRKYLNNMIFGFSHAGYMTGAEKSLKQQETVDCNCTETDLNFGKTKEKKMVRSVGLIFGVETLKNLYLLTGVSSLKKIDNGLSHYVTHIDAGAKYFFKNVSLTARFNPEYYSFGIGYNR